MKIESSEFGPFVAYRNIDGLLHRENGPAIEYISGKYKGNRHWCINGRLHREDGPAKIDAYGYFKEYWYEHKQYKNIKSDEEWIKFVKLLKLLG